MSTYVETEKLPDRMLSLLSTVWKTCPTVRSDAARYFAVEVAEAAHRGWITTKSGEQYGTTWRVTVKGLTKLHQPPNPEEEEVMRYWFQSNAKDKKYNSGFEEAVASNLEERGVPVVFEPQPPITYNKPAKLGKFTPNFVLPNGIVVHTIGRLVTADRQRFGMIREQYPHLDLRFVFVNSTRKISPKSAVSYAQWSQRYGFPFADKHIPSGWLKETLSVEAVATVKGFKAKKR